MRQLLAVDELVDRLMTELDVRGELENTLGFFLSDNGMLWGEHGLTDKGVPYTPSIQVPLLVPWPGHVEDGATDDRPVANVDLVPTILEATGESADPLEPVDGRSLLGGVPRDRVLTEYWVDPVIDVPAWASCGPIGTQYAEYYDEDGGITFREYYDLVVDPWQLENLLATGGNGITDCRGTEGHGQDPEPRSRMCWDGGSARVPVTRRGGVAEAFG